MTCLESTLLAKYLRTDATVRIYHCATSYNGQKHIHLPSAQRIQLQIIPSPHREICSCARSGSISHSARALCIDATKPRTTLCAFSRQFFTPSVEELQIIVDDILKACTYLKAISTVPRHPRLQIEVTYHGPVDPDADDFREGCSEWLNLPISFVNKELYRSTGD